MRLKTSLAREAKHTELVSGVCWSSPEEVLSAADDHRVLKWNLGTNETAVGAKLPEGVYPTDLHYFPKASTGAGGKKQPGSDIFVMAATDGKFHLISRTGRTEKVVEGHTGAILSARWSYDGAALVTSREDGQIKIWSRSGMLRTTLSQNSVPVYCVAWSPDSDQILYTLGKQLVIKSLQANTKPTAMKGHDGLVLKVDWNPVTGLIVSGGEDCRYKVWDSFGRLLHSSAAHDYPVTSVAWSPDGTLFAVGSYNTLRLCDKSGWSYCLEKVSTGSLLALSWSSDSTQVVGAGGNGHVIFGHVTERKTEWKHLEFTVVDEKSVQVRNCLDDSMERLEFRDRVVKIALGWNHLVVVTVQQCYVYNTRNWNTPTIFDLKEGSVTLIVMAEKHFCMVDGSAVHVYSYEGRLVCTPKQPGMRTDILHSSTVSLSNDTLAIRDKADEKLVHLFDAGTGKPLGDGKPIQHKLEVLSLALDQCGSAADRKLAVVDKNRDLYLMTIRVYGSARRSVKLATMVESVAWNDQCNMLAALANGKLTVWYYPQAAFVDRELLLQTVEEKDASDFGKEPQLESFLRGQVTLRRSEGSLVHSFTSPFPALLHNYIGAGKWSEALRLCRFQKDERLWACLASMATVARDLSTAEVAYAALSEADKVSYIQHIKSLPSKEARNAEMLLMSGNMQDAEGALLQAGFIFRAIMLNVTLYNWERALELATKHKTHVDTVLAYRQKYMSQMGRDEVNKKFLAYADQITTDWETIQEKVANEWQAEKEKPERSSRSGNP